MTHSLVNHHITGHPVFVLVATEWVIMCPAIDNPAQLRNSRCYPLSFYMSAAEIHRELCALYGQHIMNEGTVRQWRRMFKDGRINVHDEEWSGRPCVVSSDLVQSVGQKICERWRFTVSELSCEFPQISLTVLYEIVTVRLDYHKFCERWVLEMLTGAHRTQRMASAFTFIERYHKDGDELLSHIVRVTGDET
jgi:hypothetical protein